MDWLYLQTRMAADPDLAPRTRRLLALETLLEGRQYDVLPFPFSCERSGAGEYVPLSERRPSVRTGLCRVVVEDSVSLLFSEGHFPALQATDDATRSVLPALVRELRLNETMLDAATRGSVGSVAILFRVVDDRPFFDVLSSAFLWPEWTEHDRRQLRRVTERYKVARAREQARSAVAERDAVVTTLQAESNERLIRSELQLRAVQHGILDLDGLRLLDTRAITIGQDGSVQGAEEALASFRTSKPYLFNQNGSVVRPLTTTARENAPPRAEPEPVDARQLSREQWQVERARLLARRV